MRKTALAFVLAFAAMFALAAMTRPPVEQLVAGQQQCSNGTAVCMGDKTRSVKLQGAVSFEQGGTPVPFTPNPDGGLTTLVTANNWIGSSTKALVNYDFPSLSTAAGSLNCADSSTATIARCPFGSQLLLGVDQVLVNGNGNVQPYLSAANTAFVRACANAPDAGTFNMPDASYLVRCIQ